MAGEMETTARGHLAADAVVKTVHGKEVAELRLAVGVRRKDASGEWQNHHTDWVDASVWGRFVAAVATLRKGQLVEIRGLLTPGAYLNKDGEAVAVSRMLASSVTVVPRAPRSDASPETPF